MLSSNLEKTLREAYNLANNHKHEFVTLEHLLFSLTEDKDALSVLNASGVSIKKLKYRAYIYFHIMGLIRFIFCVYKFLLLLIKNNN